MIRLAYLVVSAILVAAGAHAETSRVNATTDTVDPDPGDGICGTLLFCCLRQAV